MLKGKLFVKSNVILNQIYFHQITLLKKRENLNYVSKSIDFDIHNY
jgi:hypothetical protein